MNRLSHYHAHTYNRVMRMLSYSHSDSDCLCFSSRECVPALPCLHIYIYYRLDHIHKPKLIWTQIKSKKNICYPSFETYRILPPRTLPEPARTNSRAWPTVAASRKIWGNVAQAEALLGYRLSSGLLQSITPLSVGWGRQLTCGSSPPRSACRWL